MTGVQTCALPISGKSSDLPPNVVRVTGSPYLYVYAPTSYQDNRVPWGEGSAGQPEEPSWCRLETAGVAVERVEVRLVVHVEPFAARSPCLLDELPHQAAPHSSPLVLGVDDSVEKERVKASVPAGVNEPDECVLVEGSNPGKAVLSQPAGPGQNLTGARCRKRSHAVETS